MRGSSLVRFLFCWVMGVALTACGGGSDDPTVTLAIHAQTEDLARAVDTISFSWLSDDGGILVGPRDLRVNRRGDLLAEIQVSVATAPPAHRRLICSGRSGATVVAEADVAVSIDSPRTEVSVVLRATSPHTPARDAGTLADMDMGAPPAESPDAGTGGPLDAARPSPADGGIDAPRPPAIDAATDTSTSKPPPADAAAPDSSRDVAALWDGPGPAVVLLIGTQRRPGEDALADRLAKLGARTSFQSDPAAALAERPALVIIGPGAALTTAGRDLLRTAAVSILCMKQDQYEGLDMVPVGGADRDTAPEITIARPEHPVAAELKGTVNPTTAGIDLGWGRPAASSIIIAYVARTNTKAALFLYDKASLLVSGAPAPARRIGFFLKDLTSVPLLNENGWRLFDASVTWAVSGN